MKKILFLSLFISLHLVSMAQTKLYDILSYTSPTGFVLKEKGKRLLFQKKEGNTFCVLQVWPAQQGSSDPQANFKTDWDYFADKQYKTGEPKEKQSEKHNGWDVVTGVGVATVDGIQFIVSVSTFTQGDISWCAITQFNDEKYGAEVDHFFSSVNADAKKFVRKNNPPVNNTTTVNNSQPVSNGFYFTRTNFDDGWVAIPKQDWVETTKGNIKALIHYPNKQADEYNSDGDVKLKTAWNILVAPRYSNASNMFFKDGDLYDVRPDYASAEMTENATGKRVYVVFAKTQYWDGSGKYVEIIAPNQQAFEQVFGNYETNKANRKWEQLDKIQGYNKFAVAASDLAGTWTSNFSDAVTYVSVFTGLPASSFALSSWESFQFLGGGKYKWDLAAGSGQVGNMQFQTRESTGNVTVPDNWHVQFSDIEGRPQKKEVMFSCIKGLRILWIDGKPFAKKN